MVSNSSETKKIKDNIKFLCSYGGMIVNRSSDGKLRYVGGLTRVLSIDRSTSFAELMVKLGEFCGYSVELKCQLPNGDFETLVSIKSEEEFVNLVELYDITSPGSKIRAVLSPPRSLKTVSPPSSIVHEISLTKSRFLDVNNRCQRFCLPASRNSIGVSRFEEQNYGLWCYNGQNVASRTCFAFKARKTES